MLNVTSGWPNNSVLETKPTPQPSKQEFPGLSHTSSNNQQSPHDPCNKTELPEHANPAATTYVQHPGLQGHQLSLQPQERFISGPCLGI